MINFTAPTTSIGSLLRVYVERHTIDIDIALYDWSTTAGRQVASGSNSAADEETFVYLLTPGAHYGIEITFWRLVRTLVVFALICSRVVVALQDDDSNVQTCPTFRCALRCAVGRSC